MAAPKTKHPDLMRDAVEDVSNLRADIGRAGPAPKGQSAAASVVTAAEKVGRFPASAARS